MSIKNKIALFVSILFGMLLIAVAALFSMLTETEIRQTAIIQQTAMVNILAQSFDQHVKDRHRAIINVAKLFPTDIIRNPDQVQQFLSARLILPSLFTNILVYAPNGKVLASNPYKPAYKNTKLLSSMEYIQHTVDSGQPYISKLFVSPVSGEPLIVMTAPIKDASGNTIAILIGSRYIRKENLFSQFSDIKIGKTGYLLLITKERVLVSFPDKARLMERVPAHKIPGLETTLRDSKFARAIYHQQRFSEITGYSKQLVMLQRNNGVGMLADAFNELTLARQQSQLRELSRNQVLEMIARGAPLTSIL